MDETYRYPLPALSAEQIAPLLSFDIEADPYEARLAEADALPQTVASLESKAGVSPTPADAAEWGAKVGDARRYELADRLWRLAYLSEQGQAQDAAKLRTALLRFQADAGLSATGWGDADTWDAVHALVALDVDMDLARWTQPGAGRLAWRPAFRRAVRLRLSLLAFYEHRIEDDSDEDWRRTVAAAQTFASAAVALGLPDVGRDQRATLSLLFDHDRLFDALSTSTVWKPLSLVNALGFRLAERRLIDDGEWPALLARRLVQCELYLQGYEVSSFRVKGAGAEQRSLRDDLEDYAKAEGLDDPGRVSRTLGPDLVRRLAVARGQPEAEENIKPFGLMFEDDALCEALRVQVSADRTRPGLLWDGARHAGSWLGRHVRDGGRALVGSLRRGAGWAAQGLRQLARWIWQVCSEVMTVVRAAMRAFGAFVLGELRVGPQAGLRLHPDMDLDILVHPGASPAEVQALTATLRRQDLGFQIASTLLGAVLDVLQGLAKLVIGWVRMVAQLASELRPLLPMGRQLLALG